MPKVEINPIQNLDNPNSVINTINGNFNRIQDIIETLLSRDGRVPNSMLADLNMNAYRILNLPPPITPTEPARHGDIQQYVDQAEEFRNEAEGFRNEAEGFRDETEEFHDETEEFYVDFQARYLGAYPEDPVEDNFGEPLVEGAIYFNTTINNWRVFIIEDVYVLDDEVLVLTDQIQVSYWYSFPQSSLLSLSDVDADNIDNNQLLAYFGGLFVPWNPEAGNISFDDTNTQLNASNVQDAIEDLVDRTSLGRYDLSFYIQGLADQNERLFRLVASRVFFLPVNLPDSVAKSRVPANSNTTFTLHKNDTQIGTLFFAEASDEGVFTFAGTETFNPGDIFEIRGPSVMDTTLRDTSITIAARR